MFTIDVDAHTSFAFSYLGTDKGKHVLPRSKDNRVDHTVRHGYLRFGVDTSTDRQVCVAVVLAVHRADGRLLLGRMVVVDQALVGDDAETRRRTVLDAKRRQVLVRQRVTRARNGIVSAAR